MFDSKGPTVSGEFFAPLKEALAGAPSRRDCPSYTDETHLIGGVNRALSDHRSGRAWLQSFRFVFEIALSVDCFFKALRSKRRAELVEEVNLALVDGSSKHRSDGDPFALIPELDKFAIYAADGHSIAHSAHEAPIREKKRASNHIFSLNLRTQLMEHVDLCVPESGKAKRHEVATLKALSKKALRMRQPKGVKVVHAYDPAVVDYRFWLKLKEAGIYIVTVEKANSRCFVTGDPPFDRDDPRNAGVLADQWVATSNNVMIRRITYQDPVTGRIYKFLTTIIDAKVPPGAIAFIYKCRWNIEKVFDQTKNRFMERKSWGKSEQSKHQQANFICLAHNLCVLLESKLESDEGIVDGKALAKQEKRKREESQRAIQAGRMMNALVQACELLTQRSCQFIRWLRLAIDYKSPWKAAVELLRPLMDNYLA